MSDLHNFMNSPAAVEFAKGLISKTIKPITYYELLTLRNNHALQQGMTYRITDYHCTSMDENAESAGHRFDILIQALDNSTLSEVGRAMKHDFTDGEVDPLTGVAYTQAEKNYFNGTDFNSWIVYYSIDNDQTKCAWSFNGIDNFATKVTTDSGNHKLCCNQDIGMIDGKYAFTNTPGAHTTCYLCTSLLLDVGEQLIYYDITGERQISSEEITASTMIGIPTDIGGPMPEPIGHGVIYRLIDEYGNDLPYDFKNIMFKRDADWRSTYSGYYNTAIFNSNHEWFYTFTNESTFGDGSLTKLDPWVYNNTIGPVVDDTTANRGARVLNNSIFLNNCHNNDICASHHITSRMTNKNYMRSVYNFVAKTSVLNNTMIFFHDTCSVGNIEGNIIQESYSMSFSGQCLRNAIYGAFQNTFTTMQQCSITGSFSGNTFGGTIQRCNFSGNVTNNTFNLIGTYSDVIADRMSVTGSFYNNTTDTLIDYLEIPGTVHHSTLTTHGPTSSRPVIQKVTISGDVSYSSISSGAYTTNVTSVEQTTISGQIKWADISADPNKSIKNVEFAGNIIGTSNSSRTSVYVPGDSNRKITIDIDANNTPYWYYPGDVKPSIVNMTATTAEIQPGIFYVWGTVSTLSLSFAPTVAGYMDEYHFKFTAGSGMTLSLPSGITWANGTVPPRTQGKTYEISIIGYNASYLEF